MMIQQPSDKLLLAIQNHQALFAKRLKQCSYLDVPYAVYVRQLNEQKIASLQQSIINYEQQSFWTRLLLRNKDIQHQRRLLALYYEQCLLKQLLGNAKETLTLQRNLTEFARWQRYTPRLSRWSGFTSAVRRFFGFSRRLRDYQAFERSLSSRSAPFIDALKISDDQSAIAIIGQPIQEKQQAQREVDRLFSMRPSFDPYRVLGLLTMQGTPDYQASTEAVKKAYRRLIQQYHPDKLRYQRQGSGLSVEDINQAYNLLSCPLRRKLWNEKFNSTSVFQDLVIILRQRSAINEQCTELKQRIEVTHDKVEKTAQGVEKLAQEVEKMKLELAKMQQELAERAARNKEETQEKRVSIDYNVTLAQQGLFTKSVSAAAVLSPNEDMREAFSDKYIMDC